MAIFGPRNAVNMGDLKTPSDWNSWSQNGTIIRYNGISSADIGVVVESFPDYNYPGRNFEAVHVPGLNGDILLDDGSYENVNRTYKISCYKSGQDFHRTVTDVVKWLHPSAGYHELEDGYDTAAYRMATVFDPGDVVNMLNMAGTAVVNFNCKPQRFLNTGKSGVVVSGSRGQFTNLGTFPSHPLIKITTTEAGRSTNLDFELDSNIGDGVHVITNFTIQGSSVRSTNLELDCELQDLYGVQNNGSYANANHYLRLTDGRFPKFDVGVNVITMTTATRNAISRFEVTPRWWTL